MPPCTTCAARAFRCALTRTAALCTHTRDNIFVYYGYVLSVIHIHHHRYRWSEAADLSLADAV